MEHHEYNLICIGSGPAGQRAAIPAAKLGKKVAVVEKQRFVGGVCVDTGTIPSKTFREAVRRVYSRPGLELTDPFAARSRVRPTMQELVGHVGRVIQREIGLVHDALTRNDVTVVHGQASFADSPLRVNGCSCCTSTIVPVSPSLAVSLCGSIFSMSLSPTRTAVSLERRGTTCCSCVSGTAGRSSHLCRRLPAIGLLLTRVFSDYVYLLLPKFALVLIVSFLVDFRLCLYVFLYQSVCLYM